MAAGKRNIVIEQKIPFFKKQRFLAGRPTNGKFSTQEQIEQDVVDGVLVITDLTGGTCFAKMKGTNGTEVSFTTTVAQDSVGWYYTFSLTEEQTTALNFIYGTYDVRLVFPDNGVRTVEGNVKVEAGLA